MGFVNNLAGGGGVLGLLAFDLAGGLAPGAANASLRPAALTIAVSGALGFSSRHQPVPRRAWLWGLAAVPGAVAGAILAVKLPAAVYQTALTIVVAVTFVQTLRHKHAPHAEPPDRASRPLSLLLFTLVGLHMGFLQVGVGLLIMAVLTRVHSRNLVAVNAAKMAVVGATSVASVAALAASGAIVWSQAAPLAVGTGIGSFVAGRWSVRRGHGTIRIAVLAICVVVLVRMAIGAF
ncbi:MAG: sulfite exporter TauE/SafE family protein [Planctomycetes bacterium]|nr:sulfite exporter TauE/SafE family protein [Planctomycetota bacterium]